LHEDARVGTPEPRYAKTADGTHIAYLVMGDGPVDLLYTFGYQSCIDADGEVPFHAAFRERLASGFRLILFDRRGTGLSDRTGLEGPGALELGMDDMLAVMDATSSERPLVFGVTDGCLLAALFAASHPDRVLGLILWGLYARGTAAPDYPFDDGEAEWSSDMAERERIWGSVEYAELEMRAVAPDARMDRATLERVAKMFRSAASPGSALSSWQIIHDSDIRPVLPAIQVPALVLGSADAEDIDETRFCASLIPGANFVAVPGRDALPFWTAGEPVVDQIRSFSAKVRHEEEVLDRFLTTVLFTDIVGSTDHARRLGDRGWKDTLERHHAVVRAMLRRYRGTEVDTAGDGFFATFDGPARAVRCAEAIGEALRPLELQIRAGVHTGEVETIDGKVGGLGVVIGARIGAIAGPSEVLVSSTVKDLTAGSGLIFDDAGEHALKGVGEPWRVYRVALDSTSSPVGS
jgi:class 3 adenylate cyclase/pimeloyl-ACP methyl ester carboxylesterase